MIQTYTNESESMNIFKYPVTTCRIKVDVRANLKLLHRLIELLTCLFKTSILNS